MISECQTCSAIQQIPRIEVGIADAGQMWAMCANAWRTSICLPASRIPHIWDRVSIGGICCSTCKCNAQLYAHG